MKLLKVSQVADRFNVSRGKVYKMIKKRVITCHNIDGCMRISEEEVNKMLHCNLIGKNEGKHEKEGESIKTLFGDGAGEEDSNNAQ